jgi:hypothetical protein
MDFKNLTTFAVLQHDTDEERTTPLAETLVKRLQFDVSREDYDEVEMWCDALNLTKREFLQNAIDGAFRDIQLGLDAGCIARYGMSFNQAVESGIHIFSFVPGGK